jgi:hypothetical protein
MSAVEKSIVVHTHRLRKCRVNVEPLNLQFAVKHNLRAIPELVTMLQQRTDSCQRVQIVPRTRVLNACGWRVWSPLPLQQVPVPLPLLQEKACKCISSRPTMLQALWAEPIKPGNCSMIFRSKPPEHLQQIISQIVRLPAHTRVVHTRFSTNKCRAVQTCLSFPVAPGQYSSLECVVDANCAAAWQRAPMIRRRYPKSTT